MNAKQLLYIRLLNQLKREIGSMHGVPILERFRHWQAVQSPKIALTQQAHDPFWASAFQASAAELQQTLGSSIQAIHHIGSTAIPEISSKPIIDMAVVLADGVRAEVVYAPLNQLDYQAWGPSPTHPEVEWLWHRQSQPIQRVIHLCDPGNRWVSDAIHFRDYLSQHPEQRTAYMANKQAIAEEAGDDLALYSLKKSVLLYRMNKQANEWAGGQRGIASSIEA